MTREHTDRNAGLTGVILGRIIAIVARANDDTLSFLNFVTRFARRGNVCITSESVAEDFDTVRAGVADGCERTSERVSHGEKERG